ncbi:MAG: DNA starvation/stationary phase protection protein [Chitinophagales bacterium]|nr:DNA starvation/stationary phase protection protein [Chitinophagales bacterium]
MKTTWIGLDEKKSATVIDGLNKTLANFQVYYQNLRGLHWNITGKNFFELHVKFEELYTDAQLKIDLIAERILTLGGTPLHTFADYLAIAKIEIGKNVTDDKNAVNLIVENLKTLLTLLRKNLKSAQELEDEGTITMLTDFVMQLEKQVWMFNAWLK